MAKMFPRQDLAESKKNLLWCKEHLDYAEELLKNYSPEKQKMSRLYNGYIGNTSSASIKYLTDTYGKKNRTKYISYRLGKTKIDLIHGEWLEMPLNATVTTINSEAKTQKLEQYQTVLGAMHSKKEVNKLMEVGYDVLEGMPIPDEVGDPVWQSMSFRDKNEAVMQLILNTQKKDLDLHSKFAKNFQDAELVAMCYGKVEVDENGKENYIDIDPRNAIFEKIDRDPYLEKSPIMGALTQMTVHDILRRYNLTQSQRDQLEKARSNPQDYTGGAGGSRYNYVDGQFTVDVIHIEWSSIRPEYYKLSPPTKSQLLLDPESKPFKKEIEAEYYEQNKESIDSDVAKGKYGIEVKWKEELWEGTRIGHDIDVLCRRKPYTLRREDSPGDVYTKSYCGMIFNSVDGVSISLQEVIENFNNLYDVVMFQINKELGKIKGKVVTYDRAGLPKGMTVKEVLYNLMNDSFYDYNSAASGNMAGKDLSIANVIKELDLGLSASFPQLIALKREIQDTVDRLTGINENREGQIAASSTASNAQSAIRASRTITAPLFYAMQLYVEKVMEKIAETSKLTWGLAQNEDRARTILGDEKYGFLMATKSLTYASYGVSLSDGRREMEIKQKMSTWAEASLNSKELRFMDIMEFEFAPTIAEARSTLKNAWAQIQKVTNEQLQADRDAGMKNTQMNVEGQRQMMAENREDMQAAKLQEIQLAKDLDLRNKKAEMTGKMFIDQNKFDNEAFTPN